jgi:hypothetical protein
VSASGFDGGEGCPVQACGVVFQDRDVVLVDLRHEQARHERSEGESINGSLQLHDSDESSKGASARMTGCASGVDGAGPLSCGCSGKAPHEVGVDRALINEDAPRLFVSEHLHQLPVLVAFCWFRFGDREHLPFSREAQLPQAPAQRRTNSAALCRFPAPPPCRTPSRRQPGSASPRHEASRFLPHPGSASVRRAKVASCAQASRRWLEPAHSVLPARRSLYPCGTGVLCEMPITRSGHSNLTPVRTFGR